MPWEQWEGQVVNGAIHLGRYLGGGERSAVFFTRDVQRDPQTAAIKLVPADSESVEPQLSRWELAARLSHPHLMRLFQKGHCKIGHTELLYVVMEFAEENLSQVLLERAITSEEAREILGPALDALVYLHGKGFVHGRMKPANILGVNDQLKISSDGLCRIGESSGVSGTLSVYDPPELAGGEISPAGDVWSLGMTLVEALTQRLPVWERNGHEEPAVPETLPAPFLELARHCLLRDPQRRCTLADIAAHLGQTTPRTQTPAEPQKAFAKRHYIALAVTLALALAAILVGSRLLKPSPDAVRAPSAVEQASPQPRPAANPVTSETGPSSQGTNGEKPASSSVVQPPLRSEALAQTPALGRAPGVVVHQVLPDVPRKARDTIQGKVKVRVKVSVDASGSVAEAMLDSPGPSRYFAKLALQAALRWKFAPAKVDGRDVSSEWLLRFEFGRTGTTAFPARIGP